MAPNKPGGLKQSLPGLPSPGCYRTIDQARRAGTKRGCADSRPEQAALGGIHCFDACHAARFRHCGRTREPIEPATCRNCAAIAFSQNGESVAPLVPAYTCCTLSNPIRLPCPKSAQESELLSRTMTRQRLIQVCALALLFAARILRPVQACRTFATYMFTEQNSPPLNKIEIEVSESPWQRALLTT